MAAVAGPRAVGPARAAQRHQYGPWDQGGWTYDNPGPLFTLNGAVYYMGQDSLTGQELWKSDGTGLVRDIHPGPFRSYLPLFTRLNNTVYFVEGGARIWKTVLSGYSFTVNDPFLRCFL